MKIVDANVLLYAVNEDAVHHSASREWLDTALGGGDTVGLTWMALLAFVRLSTKQGLFVHPLTIDEAMLQVQEWIDAPGAELVQPTPAHAGLLREALTSIGVGGNLTNDAHIAALAREHRAAVVSYDSDFSRFAGIRTSTPDQLLA